MQMVAMRRTHPVFGQAWEVALDIATDGLELEARRRAADGDPSFLFRNGEKVQDHRSNQSIVIKRYSDRLLEFLLKANRPKRFGTLTGSAPEEAPSDAGIADDPDPPRSERGRRD